MCRKVFFENYVSKNIFRKTIFEKKVRNIVFKQYLPKTFNYTIQSLLNNQTIYDDISIDLKNLNETNKYILYSNYVYNFYAFELNILPKTKCNLMTNEPLYFRQKYTSFGHLNELFIRIVRYETQSALNLYYQQRLKSQIMLNEYNMMQGLNPNNSIALHWRCGDILRLETGSSLIQK